MNINIAHFTVGLSPIKPADGPERCL